MRNSLLLLVFALNTILCLRLRNHSCHHDTMSMNHTIYELKRTQF